MQKYIYYLADSPTYPNEIFASSKAEVRKLILENVPDESHILKIIEAPKATAADDAKQAVQSAPEEEIDPNDFKDSQDYFKAVMSMAQKESAKQPVSSVQAPPQPQPQPRPEPKQAAPAPVQVPAPVQPPVKQPPKIFEEAGMFFKLEDGKLFKKQWVNVSGGDLPQFRIKSATTGKIVPNDKYIVEKLEWVEINPE